MRLTDEQIGAELHGLRPTPDPAFAARLDRRVEAGFPAQRLAPESRGLRWNRLLPALGALATIVVLIVVINENSGTDFTSNDAVKQAAPSETIAPNRDLAPQTTGGVTGAGVPPIAPAPPGGPRPRNGRPQVQELSASLGFSTDADKLQEAADGVVAVTGRYDGFVDSSNVHAGGSNGRAFFALRIPAANLRNALEDLSDLGRVVSRDEGSANVTGAYVDAGKAFRDARAKVDSLLERLRNASSPSEAQSLRRQLVTARQELAASRQALRGIKQQVTYATVSVDIRANGDGSWSLGDAADDAVGVLEAIGGAALVTLAVLVPLSALLALGWLGTRELQRRRREAGLDR
jgi:hypothetical protein